MATATIPSSAQQRFQRLAAQWKEESRFLSNTGQMAMLDSYQRIIGIGPPAIPLILKELQREPDQWLWALEAITEENPVPNESAGNVQKMTQIWLEWGYLISSEAAPHCPQ